MNTNIVCLNCEGKNFIAKLIDVKIEGMQCKRPGWVCIDCGKEFMDSQQMDKCLKIGKKK